MATGSGNTDIGNLVVAAATIISWTIAVSLLPLLVCCYPGSLTRFVCSIRAAHRRACEVAIAVGDHIDPVPTPQYQGRVWILGETVTPPRIAQQYGCPNCRCTAFNEGPSGGSSTNIECTDCHLRWNLTVSTGVDVIMQYIGHGAEYNQVRVAAKFARRRAGIAV